MVVDKTLFAVLLEGHATDFINKRLESIKTSENMSKFLSLLHSIKKDLKISIP
jgi:hypothetical protein